MTEMPAGVQHSSVGGGRNVVQLDRQVVIREEIARALRPLDEYEGLRLEHVIPADVLKVLRSLQAVEIDMVDGRPGRLIFVNDRERRAADIDDDAVSGTDGARERRLAGTQIARQRNQKRRLDLPPQTRAPFSQLVFRE